MKDYKSLLFATALASFGCNETIYDGEISPGVNVNYSERNFGRLSQNKMVIEENGNTSILVDEKDFTNIDWKNNFLKLSRDSCLEYVNIESKTDKGLTNNYSYYSKDIKEGTIDGEHTKKIFQQANEKYNNLRTQIRKKLRDDYNKEHKPLEKIIK